MWPYITPSLHTSNQIDDNFRYSEEFNSYASKKAMKYIVVLWYEVMF